MPSVLEHAIAGQYVAIDNRADWAFKEAPSSYVSDYILNWNRGNQGGPSMDALETATGIRILETGVYLIIYHHRKLTGPSASPYAGIALNGNRTLLDTTSNNEMWDHSHVSNASSFLHSDYLGPLTAGDLITAGPPSTYSTDFAFGTPGYLGTLYMIRIK